MNSYACGVTNNSSENKDNFNNEFHKIKCNDSKIFSLLQIIISNRASRHYQFVYLSDGVSISLSVYLSQPVHLSLSPLSSSLLLSLFHGLYTHVHIIKPVSISRNMIHTRGTNNNNQNNYLPYT